MHNAKRMPTKRNDSATQGRLSAMIQRARSHNRFLAVLSCLAVAVAVIVSASIMMNAFALLSKERVLDCQFTGEAAHTHNEDCYDKDGNLVCTLPERAKHAHTGDCYDEEGNLICGKEELTSEHVHGPGCFIEVPAEGSENEQVEFNAASFSTYGIVTTSLEQTLEASDGKTYVVTVDCPEEAGIPEGAKLQVEEVAPASRKYVSLVDQVSEELIQNVEIEYARFFDISIVSNDTQVQPDVPVDVRIELADSEVAAAGEQLIVAHIPDTDVVEEIAAEVSEERNQSVVTFEAESFSIYAIVTTTLEDTVLTSDGKTYQVTVTCAADAGIPDDAKLHVEELKQNSGAYDEYLQQAADALGVDADNVSYAKLLDISILAGNKEVQPAQGATLEVSIRLLDKQGSEEDSQVVHFGDETEVVNAQIDGDTVSFEAAGFSVYAIVDAPEPATGGDDPYELDGKTYGIIYNNESVSAAALTAQVKKGNNKRLAGQRLLVRPDVLDKEGIYLMAQESEIIQWTFESAQGTQYYITTEVDGTKKYLTLSGDKLTLESEPANGSLITATPGTGAQSGKWLFKAGTRYLYLSGGKADDGFGSGSNTNYAYMNLVSQSDLLDDDNFNLYTARKVSVSDEVTVTNGCELILYVRVWNEDTLRYEFYVVDHDGSLFRCYDIGDEVEWIGSDINTASWIFTEYHDKQGLPTYYYEFQNKQYDNYIAPQVTGEQIMSDSTIGVNLNGRKYAEDYTTIIAWDDASYAYAGLKVQDGHLVSCPLAEADDFYFAVVTPVPEQGTLTTVKTIDNDDYGITMKMQNYEYQGYYLYNSDGKNGVYRQEDQTNVVGYETNGAGLLARNLDEATGYPQTVPAKTGKDETSLGDLYSSAETVNHLFIESVYNESGYFEFNSAQNYAYLDGGNFTVYDQLGTTQSNDNYSAYRAHGMFLPYNSLEGKYYSTVLTNNTNIYTQELPDTDPRKGEKLYQIRAVYPKAQNDFPAQGDADYFFGMEMGASFTQTASGLDAWGHDIIFEFSGDDDFWLYVDGVLVIDLGGIHSAQSGTVNFRTGDVTFLNTKTTLRKLFKAAYEEKYPNASASDVTAYLNEVFGGEGTVFADYTTHDMKMFYMERGAGSSNLHMRFNLAAVKKGTFILSKTLSGAEESSYDLVEFPYQIYYTTKDDGEHDYHLLGQTDENGAPTARYVGTSAAVKFAESFTPAGGSEPYQNVFFLKPGQSAEITLPEDTVNYYVVECGVNPDIYDAVTVNGDEATESPTSNTVSGTARCDYSIKPDTLEQRSKVEYDNHVREGAMRSLSITKRLYDVDGQTLLHYEDEDPKLVDQTTFSFRLHLGDENADPNNLPLAYMYEYHVRDAEGNYCKWDANAQRFVSLDVDEYDNLTAAQKAAATFHTSMNGSISKIPADYTVEVRNVIISTQYQVIERDYEIPKGYKLRLEDGYTRIGTDGTPMSSAELEALGEKPNAGTIRVNDDPKVEVRNQKGWGLTVEKVWTDKDFMETHDPIHFAIYLDGSLLQGSVRELETDETEIYYFFDDLENGHDFADYVVREVKLTGDYTVDEDGKVTVAAANVKPVGPNGTIVVGGKPVGRSQDDYTYTVTYEVGEQTTRNENVRTDTVTNSRPGIALYKKDWAGTNLGRAVFTLKDQNDNDVAAPTYISRSSDGLITIAYLPVGTYTLTETDAPRGYVVPSVPMTITVSETGEVTVGEELDSSFYTLDKNSDGMQAVITIKNRSMGLQVKKVDAETEAPLSGVHFALYPQVTNTNNEKVKDYHPKDGFEDIVTDDNGILPNIDMEHLAAGTYYLTETRTQTGYTLLGEDLCFTIGRDGTVTLVSGGDSQWLSSLQDSEGNVSYVLTIPNESRKNVKIKKVSSGNSSVVLEGAVFELYTADAYDLEKKQAKEGADLFKTGTTDKNGLLDLGDLAIGTYYLVETQAPEGYSPLTDPIEITVDATVMAKMSISNLDVKQKTENDVTWFEIEVGNNPGVLLPHTGGPGTTALLVFGSLLVAAAGIVLVKKQCQA